MPGQSLSPQSSETRRELALQFALDNSRGNNLSAQEIIADAAKFEVFLRDGPGALSESRIEFFGLKPKAAKRRKSKK